MNRSILLCLLFTVLFSGAAFSQSDDDLKITVKEKGKKVQNVNPKENLPHFIQFGIMTKNHEDFRNKYKIDVKYENCVISPFISKKAKENNLAIAKLLTEKYGNVWKKDLEIIPYGL